MDLIFDPAAIAEVDEAVDHYQSLDEPLARAFLEELENASARILAHPHVWQCVFKHYRRLNLQRFPYAIIYAFESDHVFVVAVMHERRCPNYWLKRTKKP